MKRFLLLLPALLLSSCCHIDILTEDVPQSVINNFHAKFPYATNVDWEVGKYKGRLAYEASFRLEKKKKLTWFKGDGTLLKEK